MVDNCPLCLKPILENQKKHGKYHKICYQEKWRKDNRNHYLELRRGQYQRAKIRGTRWQDTHYERHRELQNEWFRNFRNKIKLEVLNHYSDGTNICKDCRTSDIRILTIDHIHGGGSEHRRELKTGNFYLWLKQNNYPEGYEVVCHNCNWLRRLSRLDVGVDMEDRNI